MGTMSSEKNITNVFQPVYDRVKELKAFDDTKIGVKGLVDSGAKDLPKIFIRPPDELSEDLKFPSVHRQIPVISFEGIGTKEHYDAIVKEVLYAAENWGFFQVVNHGIPLEVLDKMLQGMRMFHEQDTEAKKEFYSRDMSRQVLYLSNYDLYKSQAANWRDSLAVNISNSGHLDPEELPEICRDVMLDYTDHVLNLGDTLLELLSVALGLRPDRLKEMECSKGWNLVNHYYPACPVPELTLGTSKHSDPSFLTIVLQDQIGGLQVLHENQWVDVEPIPGSFVVNIGDILQMISNDKLKSVYHRVTANHVGPRISVPFFLKGLLSSPKLYRPIEELLSDESPSVYREFTLGEFHTYFYSLPLGQQEFEYFKLQKHGVGE
ncbi:hypothetical protein SOVF_126630 [Spinacia oleracea]|uniref:1-aminocyclopropane-1-carboxylate oxidase homolog 3 n=1 Tax=Spinacia oleracea TaxID=3562 RepID=A0A9R0K964_SPIOL|nr:1-aminocyclopropane-1-carboxylate oxidase homolog 3-like [Spinacia oleracea]XP_021863110.1 1-aminocyclopropane-1-carboxylate oxidase homolog 3-like [Spinacia oleracea]XP_056694627.1 1-aminocyclopropane-1-carboxylate oxidase homolog 3-like [Spinacia oleracea]KNA12366.1 hypothetical protein SOVF_126630 [Spinacia oleracea]